MGKEDISMANEPTKHYVFKVMEDTKYYRKAPHEGAKPDGVFKAGTRVSKILDQTAGYHQVDSDTHVKAWISSKSPLLWIFRPTHETTEETPYWFYKATPDMGRFTRTEEEAPETGGPPDGTLPEETKVQMIMSWEGTHYLIRWFEGGPDVTIDARKSPLKPL
jgi:hypothetical protein